MRALLLFLISFLLAFLLMPKMFVKIPVKNILIVALIHAVMYSVIFHFIHIYFPKREGYANNIPFFSQSDKVFDYCMSVNRPPFMGSLSDTINHCLDRISGSKYVPASIKEPKKVRFTC